MLQTIKNFFNREENKALTEELNNVILERKANNLVFTMQILKKYLVNDQLIRTGLLYSTEDKYIKIKAQQLFWEWKNEGLINEFDDFEDTTKSWILAYS